LLLKQSQFPQLALCTRCALGLPTWTHHLNPSSPLVSLASLVWHFSQLYRLFEVARAAGLLGVAQLFLVDK
jgi:hypothetical protein